MPLGQFSNQTETKCTPPLLDEALFNGTKGYIKGRYCGLGSFEDGTTCCFPCPIQDWLYPPAWQQQLRVPNYLSILSVILCSFLLLSFAVLPPSATHRHYLSVGLLFPVLLISLSFAIPVSTNPPLCHDAITPNYTGNSASCALTGSLVSAGGLGSVIWVFLRSLWLHIRIFWDRDPGKRFKWGSIVFGTLLPLVFLIAIWTATGFSYRMGQTCLPNHDNAIVTFWVWLVIFAVLAFLLQAITTGYCFYVYARTIKRERRHSARNSYQHRQAQQKVDSWSNVKQLFLLQWRNILVSVFVIIGSISFFVVFWTQDAKLGRVFNDEENLKPVKTWIICQTLSMGDKAECRKYVKNFTVDQAAVLTSLILASLVGIEIFILLFRVSMLGAWTALFRRLGRPFYPGRPPSPLLTSLENAEKYQSDLPHKQLPLLSVLSTGTSNSQASSTIVQQNKGTDGGTTYAASAGDVETGSSGVERRPTPFDTATEVSPRPDTPNIDQPVPSHMQSAPIALLSNPPPHSYTPVRSAPSPPATSSARSSATGALTSKYTPMRPAPSPPTPRPGSSHSSIATTPVSKYMPSRFSTAPTVVHRSSTNSERGLRKSTSSKVRGRISAPVPASFVHVDGVSVARGGPLG